MAGPRPTSELALVVDGAVAVFHFQSIIHLGRLLTRYALSLREDISQNQLFKSD